MGCIFGSVKHKIDCLQGLKMDSFVKLSQVFLINLKPNEDIDYASEPFLPMSPMDALRTGNYAKDVQVHKFVKSMKTTYNSLNTFKYFQNNCFINVYD